MKTKNELEKQLGNFRELETETLTAITDELKNIIENPQITEDSLNKLSNIIRQLLAMKDSQTQRLINILKQNHMID